MAASAWRNRIAESGETDPGDLLANEKNWRIHPEHQQRVMSGALDEIGWIQRVVVNRRSGRIIDGHMRVIIAKARGERVPVDWVDLTEEEEGKALASFDAVGSLAVLDWQALADLLDAAEPESDGLTILFEGLAADAAEALEEGGAPAERKRDIGSKTRPRLRVVLAVDQLDVFERALRKTGSKNRGDALIEICRSFIDDEERQLDNLEEDQSAA